MVSVERARGRHHSLRILSYGARRHRKRICEIQTGMLGLELKGKNIGGQFMDTAQCNAFTCAIFAAIATNSEVATHCNLFMMDLRSGSAEGEANEARRRQDKCRGARARNASIPTAPYDLQAA